MKIKNIAISLLVGGLFVMSGCGGGGGSGSTLPSKPSDSQMQSLSDSNADKSVKGVAIALGSNYGMGDEAVPGASLRVKSKLAKIARISTDRSFRTEDASSICDSGSAKLSETSATKGSMTYSNCKIGESVFNGKIDLEVSLDGEGDIKAVTGYYKNFSMKNSSEKIDSKIDYAKIYINYYDDKVSISKMTATVKIKDKVEKYINFNISKEEKFIGDNYAKITEFSGYIKPKCIDGFVYVKSLPSIKSVEDENYEEHTTGKFKIESKDKTVMVEIKSDDQIKITKPSGEVDTMSKDEFDTMMQDECN